MKILVIGDFHGKFPKKLQQRLKKENFDIILSVGDFCGSQKLSYIIFKHYYGKSKKEEKKLPKKIKKEYTKFSKKAVLNGINILKKIKKFNKPFYSVHGNWEPTPFEWDIGSDENPRSKYLKIFNNEFKKEFELIDFKIKEFDNFVLVGGAPTSHPGRIDKKSLQEYIKKRNEEDLKEIRRKNNLKKKHYKSREKKFIRAFKKAKKLKKPIIFLTHNCPYNTKLDVIRAKDAHELAKGEHYGSYLERLMIKRFKPHLVICGHMHENPGKDKIGRSLVVNVGAALDKRAGIIDFPENKRGKIKVKFIK